jgi:uncharacterized protein GlcG (DUF336 family)
MDEMTLETARKIIAAVFAKGREMSLPPLTAAVLDKGGCIIALERQDDASSLRPKIAVAKAAGALGLGVSSRRIAEMALERPTFIASLALLANDGIIPAAGGIIVVGLSGKVVGAVGVTGASSDQDEVCALEGVAAAGLLAKS